MNPDLLLVICVLAVINGYVIIAGIKESKRTQNEWDAFWNQVFNNLKNKP